jgi:predicted SAM-dependent methyltransferase
MGTRWWTLPSYWLARVRYRLGAGDLHVHLGSGPHYIDGMVNVEGNILRKKDLWLDLRIGLPFPTGSVAFIYCSHMLEHLFPEDAVNLLNEMRRVLKPDGVCRLAVPSVEHALVIAAGKATCDWPRKFDDPMAQAVNYLFCDGQHKYAYSAPLLSKFASDSGFGRIVNFSSAHGVAEKQYGKVCVGNEPEGSLVLELSP